MLSITFHHLEGACVNDILCKKLRREMDFDSKGPSAGGRMKQIEDRLIEQTSGKLKKFIHPAFRLSWTQTNKQPGSAFLKVGVKHS